MSDQDSSVQEVWGTIEETIEASLIPWYKSWTIRINILNILLIIAAVVDVITINKDVFSDDVVRIAVVAVPIITSAITIYRRTQSTNMIISRKNPGPATVEKV